MKFLVLVGVLAGSARADGLVVAARVGYDHYDPCPGCEDSPQPAWGIAAGAEGGYAFALGPTVARAALAIDFFHAKSSVYDQVNGGNASVSFNLVSASLKAQIDLVPDVVFISGALGEATDPSVSDVHGMRYELGVGARVWLDSGHHKAVRADLSYARIAYSKGTAEEQYGLSLGFEWAR